MSFSYILSVQSNDWAHEAGFKFRLALGRDSNRAEKLWPVASRYNEQLVHGDTADE